VLLISLQQSLHINDIQHTYVAVAKYDRDGDDDGGDDDRCVNGDDVIDDDSEINSHH